MLEIVRTYLYLHNIFLVAVLGPSGKSAPPFRDSNLFRLLLGMWLYVECGGTFPDFVSPKSPQSDNLEALLMTFWGHGTHVRTALLLQSQHNLEGSRGSENRAFSEIFFTQASRC